MFQNTVPTKFVVCSGFAFHCQATPRRHRKLFAKLERPFSPQRRGHDWDLGGSVWDDIKCHANCSLGGLGLLDVVCSGARFHSEATSQRQRQRLSETGNGHRHYQRWPRVGSRWLSLGCYKVPCKLCVRGPVEAQERTTFGGQISRQSRSLCGSMWSMWIAGLRFL